MNFEFPFATMCLFRVARWELEYYQLLLEEAPWSHLACLPSGEECGEIARVIMYSSWNTYLKYLYADVVPVVVVVVDSERHICTSSLRTSLGDWVHRRLYCPSA